MPKCLSQCSTRGEFLGFLTQPQWLVKHSGAGASTGLWKWPVFLPPLTSAVEGLKPFTQQPQEAPSHSCMPHAHGKFSRSTEYAVERGREREGQMGKKVAGGRREIGQVQDRLGDSGGQTC